MSGSETQRPSISDGERVTVSVAEAAELLGISKWTVYECVRSGEIPSVRLGGRILIPRAKLYALVNGEAA